APTQTIQYLGAVAGGLIPVTYSWSATDPSGIGQYDAWISTNGGTFAQLTLGSPTATSGTWSLTPGSSYQMAVRARDTAGNWSTYVYRPVFTVDAFQENATAHVAISTGWTAYTGSYFGGRQYSSGVTGSSATFTFTGRSFACRERGATNRGQADVWVDDAYIGRVDTYAATTSLASAVLTLNWTTSGSHKVKVQAVGTVHRPPSDVAAMVALR